MAGVGKKSFVAREHSLKSLIGIAEEQVAKVMHVLQTLCRRVFIEEEDACC